MLINFCGNIFSKERCVQELIFTEGLFETSENKNPSKITRYMVSCQKYYDTMTYCYLNY